MSISSLAWHRNSENSQIGAAVRIVQRLLSSFHGSVSLRLWNGASYAVGQTAPLFTLVVRDPTVLRRLVFSKRNPIALADAYFRGLLDVEGDLYAALRLKTHFQKLTLTTRERAALVLDALRLPSTGAQTAALKASSTLPKSSFEVGSKFTHHHTKHSDRAAISFHYDVSNAFYKLWLDEQMVYSCAYFETLDDTLEQAQCNKLDHICRKLRLQPGEHFLDIGCGWGAMVCWAAQHYGVKAHGITLSQKQYDYALDRIARLGLQDRVTVEMRDYRDLQGEAVYDKISSIGMFEHVGLANLPVYNATVLRVLRPGGLFLNHGITHDEEGWKRTIDTEFINRYVFPDGELDTISNILRGMEHAAFEIHDVENLRAHYAMTLREWVRRLEARHEEALQFVSEDAYRVWRFYMAACAVEFEAEGTGIYQVLASKRGSPVMPVPLTRRDLYTPMMPAP
ncbi:MAG: cyclopropane-fatty-acyl-phospholipid synthase family protein [Burkholderiaceae bacterium]|nr:cyclopropane-fatty-acyl-phospholipid synthase family protein [Burkholderiaceae bacterium]